jgi:hypothetical protein
MELRHRCVSWEAVDLEGHATGVFVCVLVTNVQVLIESF